MTWFPEEPCSPWTTAPDDARTERGKPREADSSPGVSIVTQAPRQARGDVGGWMDGWTDEARRRAIRYGAAHPCHVTRLHKEQEREVHRMDQAEVCKWTVFLCLFSSFGGDGTYVTGPLCHVMPVRCVQTASLPPTTLCRGPYRRRKYTAVNRGRRPRLTLSSALPRG